MAAAVFLRSVARKMSRAAAPTTHYSPCLVARGLHGGARSGPANSNQMQQGTPDVLVSAGMAAATGLRSGAGFHMTKMAHAPLPPPPPYHRLSHGRRIHSHASSDPNPSMKKVLDAATFDQAASGMACIVLVSAAVYVHFWIKPKVDKVTAQYQDLVKETSHIRKVTAQYQDLLKKTSHIQQDQTLTAPASGPSPPAATIPVIPPLPAKPRHNQLTREAPPTLPRSEKLSPSHQQQPGGGAAARGKAIPASQPAASFSQLAPDTAAMTPMPWHSFRQNPFIVSGVILGFVTALVVIIG